MSPPENALISLVCPLLLPLLSIDQDIAFLIMQQHRIGACGFQVPGEDVSWSLKNSQACTLQRATVLIETASTRKIYFVS